MSQASHKRVKDDISNEFCSCSPNESTDNEDDLMLKLQHVNTNFDGTDTYKELQETIKELTDENGRLSKLLGEKDVEMKIIKRRWKEEKALAGGFKSENAASKIIELSRNIQDVNEKLGKEKSKYETLLNQYMELEKEKKTTSEDSIDVINENTEKPMKELTTTKEKLSQALMKSAEQRNEIESLKKELKIANKVLAQEVGETTFLSLLNLPPGWRGRQQQIISLQAKINELHMQLNSHEKKTASPNTLPNGGLQNVTSLSHHEEKNRLHMRKLELAKKEQKERLQKELDITIAERDSLKEKNNATKARIQILTKDVKTLRDQVITFAEKSKHDDELIQALLREQEFLKQENDDIRENEKKISSTTECSGKRIMKPSGDIVIYGEEKEALIEKLKAKIKEQEEKVDHLESEISILKKSKSQIPTRSSALPRRNVSSSSRSERHAMNVSLELQLEELKTFSEASYIEKEKLTELVRILEERNEDMVKESLERNYVISDLKNTVIKLEKRLEKLMTNNLSKKGLVKKEKKKSIETIREEIEELETKLSIQMDNNDALKEALQTTLKAKENDMQVYSEMAEQTKKIFLQAVRKYRQGSQSLSMSDT